MTAVDPFASTYDRCMQNAPLRCDQPQKTAQQFPDAKFCLECGFPATLPEQAEIRGDRGTYRVVGFVRSQGMGRLYKGSRVSDGKPVVIKEYLLPNRAFNAQEIQQRKAIFMQVGAASWDETQGQDFRLIAPWETIADQQSDRCYLVSLGKLAIAPTLAQTLNQNGAMSATQVRSLLSQVLQTLQFLHSQTFRRSARSNLVHGNLNLESIQVAEGFYIYVCDLAMWEHPFAPPLITFPAPDPAQDLIALGYVGFYAWAGRAIDPVSENSLDPRDGQNWSPADPQLKEFLCRLMGLETPFASAEIARQTLLRLPEFEAATNSSQRSQEKPLLRKRRRRLLWLLGFLLLLLLGGFFWLTRLNPASLDVGDATAFKQLIPTFADVNGITPGAYPYTSESIGTWNAVLTKRPLTQSSVNDLLTQPRKEIAAKFNYTASSLPLQTVINNRANFALMSLDEPLPEALDRAIVAYDGLLVFVSANKAQNFPAILEGKISLEDLQKIFTGKVTRWRDINPRLPDLAIQPYRPPEPEALKLFQHRVLHDDPALIAQLQQVPQRSTLDTIRAIPPGEQAEVATIGFGTLVQTWEQCKVYPLALVVGQAAPVQARLRETTEGKLVEVKPTDDLCLAKKPLPYVKAFVSGAYPLVSPVIVAYPKNNSLPGNKSAPRFAALLKTQEGQYLLQQAGLVPLQPIPSDYQSPDVH